MAITIQSSPILPDSSNKDLLYLVNSTQTSQPQFQYVCDVKDASGTLIQRIKQQANPAGKAVFNIGQIITNQLEFDIGTVKTDPDENTTGIYADNSSNRIADNFQIRFGEEYGTSVSSSVTLYTGVGTNTGDPAVNAQTDEFFFNGLKDYNRLPDAYTFISGSQPKFSNSGSRTLDFQDARRYMVRFGMPTDNADPDYPDQDAFYLLTSHPTSSKDRVNFEYDVRRDEYQTVSFFNGYISDADSPDGTNSNFAQDIAGIRFRSYDSDDTLISGSYFLLNSTAFGGGPRSAQGSNGVAANMRWFEAGEPDNGPDYNLITLNLGYPNVNGHNFKTTATSTTDIAVNLADASYYEISLMGYNGSSFSYGLENVLTTIRLNILDDCDYYKSVRFCWMNEFGVWDWYTATLAEEATSNVERLSFDREVINYSAGGAKVPFNASSRGTKNYLNKINRVRAVNTDWLTQEKAEWLRELFFSAEVFIQDFDNNRMLPVVITNAGVTEKTNPRTQKVFQYRVEFEMANELTSRQG